MSHENEFEIIIGDVHATKCELWLLSTSRRLSGQWLPVSMTTIPRFKHTKALTILNKIKAICLCDNLSEQSFHSHHLWNNAIHTKSLRRNYQQYKNNGNWVMEGVWNAHDFMDIWSTLWYLLTAIPFHDNVMQPQTPKTCACMNNVHQIPFQQWHISKSIFHHVW